MAKPVVIGASDSADIVRLTNARIIIIIIIIIINVTDIRE